MEMKSTIMGFMRTTSPNLLRIISFPFMTAEENDIMQNVFFTNYCECPTLHNDPVILEMFLKTAVQRVAPDAKMLYSAWKAEYNPIENYRRVEETFKDSVGNINGADSGNHNTKNRTANSGMSEGSDNSNQMTETEGSNTKTTSNNGLTENYTSAYDTTKMTLHDKQVTTGDEETEDNSNSTTTSTNKGANEESYTNETEGEETGNNTFKTNRDTKQNEHITSVISGNIGVTTSQQMIESTIDLAETFDYYGRVTAMIFERSNAFYYYFT